MKRKRRETCPSPILDDSPKRTKVQAQRKFAQNSGVHSPIITPIRDLETADHAHTSILPEPVELLPMKRPNTEDFLTFLCFRGTPILPPNLQFFNTASIVADGQVHEIKGDSQKNGPIDIAKCGGSSSDKPFIAFGVRKRADPIVISRQMEKKRRHALAIQALRRKYQEQKMAKIRALTISKLSEKTTNKTLVKTNTIQKTETVTKKNNTLHKTKVIATKHVKVTTQTLKTKVKPKMCLRSFRGKIVPKEPVPFRPRRPLPERDTIRKRPIVKSVIRTSRNSNKVEENSISNRKTTNSPQKTIKKLADPKKPLKVASKSRITRSESLGSVIRPPISVANISVKRPQIKRRIFLPAIVTSIVKPKLRSTTTKKSVISRTKAKQRQRSFIGKHNRPDKSPEAIHIKEAPVKQLINQGKNYILKKIVLEKPKTKKLLAKDTAKKTTSQESQTQTPAVSRRLTRKDSGLVHKNSQNKKGDKNETKKEITKNFEVKREVKMTESAAKKMVKKKVNLKTEFNLKTSTRDVKKNVDHQRTSDTLLEKHKSGQKVTRDVKTVEKTVQKVVTRKSEEVNLGKNPTADNNSAKDKKNNNPKDTNKTEEPLNTLIENTKKGFRSPSKHRDNASKHSEKPTEKISKKVLRTPKPISSGDKETSDHVKGVKQLTSKECSIAKEPLRSDSPKMSQAAENMTKEEPKKKLVLAKNIKIEVIVKNSSETTSQKDNDEDASKRITRDSATKRTTKEATSMIKSPKEDHVSKKTKDHAKKDHSPAKEKDQEFSKKIKELINNALKEAEELPEKNVPSKKATAEKEDTVVVKVVEEIKVNKAKELSKPPLDTSSIVLEEALANTKSAKDLIKLPKKTQKEEISKKTLKEETFNNAKNEEVLKKAEKEEMRNNAEKEEPISTKSFREPLVVKEFPLKGKRIEDVIKTSTEAEKDKITALKNPLKEEAVAKKALKQEPLSKKISKDHVPTKKDENPNPKRKTAVKQEESEQVVPIASSRPSRKTKEAAAIYMEILSHKLVNDSTIDDDNVSIDSFPELPNVKKTEQREIELKAQAKTTKEEGKIGKNLIINESVDKPKKPAKVEECPSKDHVSLLEPPKVKDLPKKIVEAISEKTKTPACNDPSKTKPSTNPKAKQSSPDKEINPKEESSVSATKTSLGKRKSNPITIASDDDSDNEVLQAKIRKSEAQKSLQHEQTVLKKQLAEEESGPIEEIATTRRQTRRCTQTIKETDSDSSDESFHIDVKVPRKKKVTRSRNRAPLAIPVSVLEKNVDIILEAARVLESEKALTMESVKTEKALHVLPAPILKEDRTPTPKESKKTDSDDSNTSDINLKSLQVMQRNKKLSKAKSSSKSSAKSAASFGDSDEEPLAKLTSKSRSVNDTAEESKKNLDKQKSLPKKTTDKILTDATIMEPKPKRECTKRPSNYLPMLSSSDEEDEPYFHGLNTVKEDLDKPKVFVQALAPSLDLLSKNIGRKGKVNMTNEEIEQWLKDSALAGISVAKENDAMLKFGEKIPTEIPQTETVSPPSIPDPKPLDPEELKSKVTEPQPCSSKVIPDDKPKAELKSPLADRKWIFKKDKKELMPNKNAFSPENECSVYAFGEENEDIVSTPFRRPSRRPSSTATSRSEDELSKNDDSLKQGQFRKPNPSDSEDSRCFNIPQNPTKLPKITKLDTMVPPSSYHSKRQTKPNLDRFPEPFDDYKYKIPSSPSASSGSSAKLYKKGPQKPKGKAWESINPVYVSDFPKPTDPAKLVEAPVFHPTDQEFQDPLEYIERIRHKAEQFGLCKIIPPSSFKPECKVSDDMRFTAYNQYVHKMLHRWGPNFKEFIAIRKYLATQSIFLKTPPLIGGMEIDLPRLYQTVQSLGGLKEVIEKKKWSKVSDHMKIPKSAQDRVTKLDDIYCKYLLPYDTLSPAEREKLFDEVETYWAKKESKNLQESVDPKQVNKPEESSEHEFYDSDENETEECTIKGKNMALNAFYRIARNTMAMYFKVAEPTALEVEQEFWRYVTQKLNHICVHSASIDCGTWGYGFAVSKNSPFARHAWNLKVLSNNSGSVLRSLGPVMGVTIPTLHVGMVFSACCWYRDPHGLPWVEYLHTGGNKIWYGIPSSSCEVFHAVMQKLVPNYCRDKELWLPSDTAMVPPGMLMDHNLSLCRTIQEPGQFIVVFPKVFTSSISTGYVVSESVYFAPLYWLKTARNLFNDLKTSCEPSMFALDKLLVSISNDNRSSAEVLRVVSPFIEELCKNEKDNRIRLRNFGKLDEEKVTTTEPPTKKKKIQSVDGDFECEICRTNLFISMVIDTQYDLIYCLEDAIKLVAKDCAVLERLKLRYSLEEAELDNIPKKIKSMIEAKLQKKVTSTSKYAGLPTLLK